MKVHVEYTAIDTVVRKLRIPVRVKSPRSGSQTGAPTLNSRRVASEGSPQLPD